ncbi:MAG: HAMP domain-containing sensor histidine kinase [Gammaproteobacteria bacterium]
MNLPNLFRTSAFRLTLLYAVLFTVSVLGLLGYVYWDTLRYLDVQTDQGIQSESDALREQFRRNGLQELRRTIAERSGAGRVAGQIYLLTDSTYARLAGNLTSWPSAVDQPSGWRDFTTQVWEDDEGHEEVRARALAVSLPGNYHLLVGRDLHAHEDLREHILQVLSVAVAISLSLALLVGLLMSRGILRRIENINRTGRSIMAGNLEQRIKLTASGDEFDQLAINLNAMLDQIQHLMEGMRQVTDNVAHDLRSPLNRMRSRLELTLLNPRSTEEYRAAAEDALVDVNGILDTFNALLNIAQAEAGANRGDWGQVNLSELLCDAADFYEPLAEENGLQLSRCIAQNLTIPGNRHLLTQAVGNLLDNAIKYTPRGGTVRLDATSTASGIEVAVCDNGPGIPAGLREQVLERFVRLEGSRTTPGNGLGLSLARAVAQLHNARLELADNRPGLRVSLLLPPG